MQMDKILKHELRIVETLQKCDTYNSYNKLSAEEWMCVSNTLEINRH